MSTRLYAPAACTPAVASVVANGSYNYVSELVYRYLATCKTGTALLDGVRVGPWTVGQTAVGEALVSPPLSGSGTLSGTWSSQLRSREYATGDDVFTSPEIYVVSNDGSTVRGTAWAIGLAGPSTELNSTNRNKTWADGDSLSSVAYQDGDRIVVKLGFSNPGTGSTPEASNNYGDDFTNSDLPVDETQTTAGIGWIEFSQTLTFKSININRLTSGSKTAGDRTVAVTAPVSPADGRLQDIVVGSQATNGVGTASPPTIADSNGGLTWVQVSTVSVDDGSFTYCLTRFRALGNGLSAGTVTMNFSSSQDVGIAWAWDEFSGVRATGASGADAIAQSKTGSSASAASLQVTLDNAATSVDDACVYASLVGTSGGSTPRTGWGEVYEIVPGFKVETQFRQNFEATGEATDGDGARVRLGMISELNLPAASYTPADALGMSGMFGA